MKIKKRFYSLKVVIGQFVPKTKSETSIILIISLVFIISAFFYLIYFPVKNYTGSHSTHNISFGSQSLDSLFWKSNYLKESAILASSDSCYLSLHIKDSMINLYLKGVLLKQAKFSKIKAKNFVDYCPDSALLSSFTLESSLSSIVKHPIMVKKAPKDTVEAYEINKQPLSLPVEEVFYTLNFDKNLIVEIAQAEKPTSDYKMHKKYFRQKKILRLQELTTTLKSFKSPEHKFYIELEMPKEDARAIYRALPENAKMLVNLK